MYIQTHYIMNPSQYTGHCGQVDNFLRKDSSCDRTWVINIVLLSLLSYCRSMWGPDSCFFSVGKRKEASTLYSIYVLGSDPVNRSWVVLQPDGSAQRTNSGRIATFWTRSLAQCKNTKSLFSVSHHLEPFASWDASWRCAGHATCPYTLSDIGYVLVLIFFAKVLH